MRALKVPLATRKVTLDLGGASAADFQNAFLADVQTAINALPPGNGVTLVGNVLTFNNPAVTSLVFIASMVTRWI